MISIDPNTISTGRLHGHLLGAVTPRPIAFASTIDKDGNINLAPFSFFNVFSANPPILIFSPARRGRDNTTKHTFENVLEVKETVINIVNYKMVQQMSLASTEYPKGVNEFVKAGFTPLKSVKVSPPRVAESPVQMECVVKEVISLGDQGAAGNLVICEVVYLHIQPDILDEEGIIDQHKIDTVARMGGNWYTRAQAGMFEVPKPLTTMGIGVDQIPETIRLSSVLTGNDLGVLGNVEKLPTRKEIDQFIQEQLRVKDVLDRKDVAEIHNLAKEYIQQGDVLSAWKVLLAEI
jgi:flavin reductase (DIM6/NTAB) family NADH-FMN oxidoreductase RutF